MARRLILAVADSAVTERHRYAARVAFETICGFDCIGVVPAAELASSNPSPDVSIVHYGPQPPAAGPWIPASGLLSTRDLTAAAPGAMSGAAPGAEDVLAFVFFCATRMEEAVEGAPRDAMGRFRGEDSAAARGGWLERPEAELRMRAWSASVGWEVPRRTYRGVATVDVDSAYAFRGKGVLRTALACARDAVLRSPAAAWRRASVAAGWGHDPYDTYAALEQAHAAAGIRPRYFILLADRGPHDRGMPWQRPALRDLVRTLAATADLGIHPGVRAHDAGQSAGAAIARERGRLESLLGLPVDHARQHYLLQRPPASWRALVEAGIRHDHSCGYADRVGFRAGIARPFPAYDLAEERPLDLMLHPVTAMDATLQRYMGCTPQEALGRVAALADAARAVDGETVLLWHNETSSNEGPWAGWHDIYPHLLASIR